MAEKPSYYRITERLLYDYKTYESAIRNLEEELEILEPSLPAMKLDKVQVVTSKTVGSVTEDCAIKRAEGREGREGRGYDELRHMLLDKKRKQRAISQTRRQLTDQENTLIWMRYDLGKPHRMICEAMHMSRSSYFDFKGRLVAKVAKYLGLL